MMRLLFASAAPWGNTGYSKPMRYLLPRLIRAGYPCAIAAYYGFSGTILDTPIDGETVTLFPMARDVYLNDIIEHHAESFGADAVVSLQDVWILEDWGSKPFRWWPWLPIDCEPVSRPVREALQGCPMPLAYSQWGASLLKEAGWPGARWMPLGVDLDIYRPKDRMEARRKVGLPERGFIAGMVAANASAPSRKSFPEVLQAWRKWKAGGGGEGWLYLHTSIGPKRKQGVELHTVAESLGLSWAALGDKPEVLAAADIIFAHQYRYWTGTYNDEHLADIYNCLDVLLSPSMGEGFGLPIVEAQACGVPVVTLNVTSMPELTFAGICLEPIQMAWEPQGGWRGIVGIDDLVGALGQFVRPDKARSARARRGALRFGWDSVVTAHWLPLLESTA